MKQRIAYIVPGNVKPAGGEESACNPCPEYAEFMQRNDATLLDFQRIKSTLSPLTRTIARRNPLHLGLPMSVLSQARDFDLFLTSGEDVGLPLAILMRLRRISKPLYMVTHGSYFGSPKFAKLVALVRNMKNVHYLCLSRSLQQTLITEFGIPATQAHATGYGIDTQFFQPQEIPATGNRPIIASAGAANRDYKSLVRATAGLEADVKIAADSAWFPQVVDIAKDALPGNIEARSYGNYLGLRQLYAQADFVVVPLYPAKYACGYAVIAEAMAMGKTVIATRTDAPCDFIEDGKTGFYIPSGDTEALKDRICFLLNNPQVAREMGAQARRRFEKEYSLEAYCHKIEQVMGLNQ
ncbi:MAG: glycosyl transferase, group 1 [Chthonomonadales bacterium]|nr:glycosyl transferase, group 1 [Chthonomonadales bacterium]